MKKIKNIIIIFCILLVCIVVLLIINKKTKRVSRKNNNASNLIENEVQVTSIDYENVKSATSFFTVQSCINKYISYINANDGESVYRILDDEYILKNNITKNNVFENIKTYDNGALIFQADKMYMETIDDNNVKYYVHGIIKNSFVEEQSEEIIIDDNFQVIVTLNFEDMIYSIMPLENGGIFDEKSN